MKMYKKLSLVSLFVLMGVNILLAQDKVDAEYLKVTNERAQKIVDGLNLNSDKKELKVRDIIAEQYRSLNKIHDGRDAEIAEIKKTVTEKEKQQAAVENVKSESDKKVSALHESYLKKLGKELNDDQIVKVKDGMTYGVLPITVDGYNDMLHNLTEEQRKYIYDALVEAREHAMDGGSSKEKHGWFGKYKGRINNYLSKQGYDLNKESADWHKRIEERAKNKQ